MRRENLLKHENILERLDVVEEEAMVDCGGVTVPPPAPLLIGVVNVVVSIETVSILVVVVVVVVGLSVSNVVVAEDCVEVFIGGGQ